MPSAYTKEIAANAGSAVAVIYLRLAATGATVGQGIRLAAAGGSWSSELYSGPVCAIHGGTGTKNLSVAAI